MKNLIYFFLLSLAACGGSGDSPATISDPPTPPDTTITIGDLAKYKFVGENPGDYAGYWVSSAGDVDGDGLHDVLVGAYDDDGSSPGAAYLILGKSLGARGTFDISQADYKIVGEEAGDWAGFVVSSGNLDGDGLDDILVGAYGVDDKGPITGAAYVILASSLGSNATIDLSQADYKLTGENPGDYAGATVANAGDVDGDGLDDVLVGALHYSSQYSNQGAAYIVLGSSLGISRNIDLSQADYKLVGDSADEYAGVSVSSAGDVNGDGLDDVVLGAYAGPNWNGAAYIVTGD